MKQKHLIILLGVHFIISISVVFAATDTDDFCPGSQRMMAEYQLTTKANGKKQKLEVHLWRNPKQVAIHYPQKQITELWERTPNDRLHLVRYFDEYQRGVEYQPVEIGGNHDWDLKRQLIASKVIDKMNLDKVVGEGCQQIQVLSYKNEQSKTKLKWLVKQELIQYYQIKSVTRSEVWKLTKSSTDSAMIDKKFAQLSEYQTTDYTDVGDNESDPFLVKMINLGHVQHGSLGFYDADGHSMDPH
ncbi:MAG TPA: hypothetical protein DCZ03_11265 [Gammaproteobacteria bacterium]|nr:hypothetical protein [Gammaproteobacteria bacterium]